MPAYDRSSATGFREIDRWRGGVGWIAHPDEDGERASHALVGTGGDEVWLVDPVDAPGIDEFIAEFGEVAGVAVLSSHHARDAGPIATRHDVAVHVPQWMDRVAARVDAPVEREECVLGSLGFKTRRVEPLSLYQGAIAYRDADGTLIVPDLLSSGSAYPVGDERIGVMLGARLFPPRAPFAALEPERILFGHGEGVFEDATDALDEALAGARRRFPRALVSNLGTNLRLFWAAMRD
ncbi:hypothetical protein [Natrialba aegyptia]|uniref:Beta-lactamase n=1 Tax=Natrialba aegyptia DSM 13077 TaxID=1227491 RepID=M0B9Z1_9EURY|nr:hypothetical protein [Natrialba aegyptia]ELZ07721.1 hypothetical protein C480_06696 [Natrialba aegyptia DSM 13077]